MDILSHLSGLGIHFTIHEHEPFYTCEEGEDLYKTLEGGHSKNLFIRDRKGNQHTLIILESHKRLDLKTLGEQKGERFSFASEERLWKWLQVKPGSVSPFNLIFDEGNHVSVWVDEDLFAHEWVYYHPGRNDRTLQIKSEDLEKFLNSTGNEWAKLKLPVLVSE